MTTTRWARARTWLVVGAGTATGLVLAVGAGPAGAVAPRVTHTVSATYNCTATILGSSHSFTSSISLSGATPATVAPGAAVYMTGFKSQVTIPASLVSTAEGDGVTWLSASGFTWNIKATHAVKSTVNAGRGFSIPKTNLPNPAANVTVSLPATGSKKVGPWTAGSTAGTMTFTDSILKFTLNDNFGISVPVSCSPTPAVKLSTTKVS